MFNRNRKTKKNVIPEKLTKQSLQNWLVEELARQTKLPPSQINTANTFESYGLDSRAAVQVSGKLEKVVEQRLSPAILFEHQSIDALVNHLGNELSLQET